MATRHIDLKIKANLSFKGREEFYKMVLESFRDVQSYVNRKDTHMGYHSTSSAVRQWSTSKCPHCNADIMDGMHAQGLTKMDYHIGVRHTKGFVDPLLYHAPRAHMGMTWCPDCHKYVNDGTYNHHVELMHPDQEVFLIAGLPWRYIEVDETTRKLICFNRGIAWK